MTTGAAQHSPDLPALRAEQDDDAWRAAPPESGRPAAAPLGRRVTAFIAAAALAVGLIGGVGIGRLTAPAAPTGTGTSGFLQGGPGGTGGMGTPGQPGQPGQLGQPGQAGQPGQPGQDGQGAQGGSVPGAGSGTGSGQAAPGTTSTT